jgi:hypothetical protein
MSLPSAASIAGLRPIARCLALDLSGAIGLGIVVAFVGTILPAISRRSGIEPIGLAALASAPYLANLMAVWAGRWGSRSMRELALIRFVGAASLSTIVVLPHHVVVVGAALAFWASLSFTNPFQMRTWGHTYPARIRGRVFGLLGMGRAAATAAAALLGAVLAERVGGFTGGAAGGLIGGGCALAYAWYPSSVESRPIGYTARDSFRALLERPILVRLVVAQSLFGGGVIAAGSLFALVYVDRLNLSLPDIGAIGVFTSLLAMMSLLVWGTVSDRFGPLVPMRIGSAMGVVGLIAYAAAPGVFLVWIAAAVIGVSTSGVDIGTVSILSEETSLASRAAVTSAWSAVGGARGLIAPFMVCGLVLAGAFDVGRAIVLCALVSTMGVVVLWLTPVHAIGGDASGHQH